MVPTILADSTAIPARVWAKIDKTDTCWAWTAAKNIGGYGVFRINHRTTIAHRFIYEATRGPIPESAVMDHTCHNTGCVNPDHLRIATDKQNGENRGHLNANNSSGVRGVHWRKDTKRWEARATHQRKVYIAGQFGSLAEAEAAAIVLRNTLYTHNDADRIPA